MELFIDNISHIFNENRLCTFTGLQEFEGRTMRIQC